MAYWPSKLNDKILDKEKRHLSKLFDKKKQNTHKYKRLLTRFKKFRVDQGYQMLGIPLKKPRNVILSEQAEDLISEQITNLQTKFKLNCVEIRINNPSIENSPSKLNDETSQISDLNKRISKQQFIIKDLIDRNTDETDRAVMNILYDKYKKLILQKEELEKAQGLGTESSKKILTDDDIKNLEIRFHIQNLEVQSMLRSSDAREGDTLEKVKDFLIEFHYIQEATCNSLSMQPRLENLKSIIYEQEKILQSITGEELQQSPLNPSIDICRVEESDESLSENQLDQPNAQASIMTHNRANDPSPLGL